jgi:hypothetical protein
MVIKVIHRGAATEENQILKKRNVFNARAQGKSKKHKSSIQDALKRWAVMTHEQRKLLPKLHPDNFRP